MLSRCRCRGAKTLSRAQLYGKVTGPKLILFNNEKYLLQWAVAFIFLYV